MSNHSPCDSFACAVRLAGGQVAFAALVGCTQSNISRLLTAKRQLPGRYVLKAEAGTGVSRHDLRPDLYPHEVSSAAAIPGVALVQIDGLVR
jgi:DNA-binding transcriptional regulator YdaS (Cro superfamily)